MIVAFLNIGIGSAQNFIPAVTNDLNASLNTPTSNVINTGNDVIYFDQDYFQVSVWDGKIAMLGWDIGNGPRLAFKLDGNIHGKIEDPDVVIHEVNNKLYAFVIYLINNHVWVEVHEYYQGNWNLYVAATPISANHNCYNPNVDVDNSGNVVAVWKEENKLRILYTDIQYSYNTIQTLLDGGNSTLRDPDVAIYSTNRMVVCYILASQSTETLALIRIDSWQTAVNFNFYNYTVSLPDYFGKPRIGASLFPTNSLRFETVVDKHQGVYNYICGFNFDQSYIVSNPTILNPYLEEYENNSPAVSFPGSGSDISVVWENNSPWSTDYDIIQKKLDINGNLTTSGDYQIVNKGLSGEQLVPSVSGKNSNGNIIFYTFYDRASDEVLYKKSLISGNSVRMDLSGDKALVSPNPAKDYIQLNLATEIKDAKVCIYDATGRIILEDEQFELHSKIQINNFKKGVYFIQIRADNYNETTKFIVL